MPSVNVERSLVIGAPVERAFKLVRDFKTWPEWSPWLIADEEVAVVFENEDCYSWKGKVCGEGKMEVTQVEEGAEIQYDLSFLKPFKSRAKVRMVFEKVEEGTQVSWVMDSKLPFFMFWVRRMLEGFVGMDYERGLNMLKDWVETENVPSRLSFEGKERGEGFVGVGLKRSVSMDGFECQMEEDFKVVREHFPSGLGFCVYYDWNVVKRQMIYLIGVLVDEDFSDEVPEGLELVTAPELDLYVVKHQGPYRHLGNAWAAGIAHGRAKLFRHSKAFPPFEFYEDEDPESGMTKVFFPMK